MADQQRLDREFCDQLFSDMAELRARMADGSSVAQHIAKSRALIEESRELMARADEILKRVGPFVQSRPDKTA